MIYVFSNVEYPESNKITHKKDDLLVFLNKAVSLHYYRAHENKIIFRRMNSSEYGISGDAVPKKYVFGKGEDDCIPKNFINDLKKTYDWDYEIEKGKAKSPTTGYMVVKYLEKEYPDQQIVLVNFGYAVQKSTYRCPWHNWKYENKELSKFAHMYTTKLEDHSVIEVVYGGNADLLDKIHISAETVLSNNPNAHITILSEEPLDTKYDNIVVDTTKYVSKVPEMREKSTYFRLLMPEYLPYDKVIYMDAKCICRGSLEELWRTDIPYIGICHSHDVGVKQATDIGVPWYGMAGLMVMNIKALKSIDFTKIAMFAVNHFKFPKTPWYGEETVINCCFNDMFKQLKTKWCYCINRSYEKYGENIKSNEAIVVNFIGGQDELFKDFYDKKKY